MLYDATAHLPLMALEDLGFVPRGESGAFVADGHTAIGGRLPVNTNGGGLNYTHSGMYGMYALQESIRQLRGEAAAQVDGVTTSLTHAIGGMFQAAATVDPVDRGTLRFAPSARRASTLGERSGMVEIGAVSGRALGLGMVVTAFVFGLRHGIDWDHLAAITDLTGAQSTPRRSMLVATCYALGHGAVVFVLGVAAVVFAERLPGGVDTVMERVVGATLLLLGVYVLVSLSRHGRDFRMRSRWMLVIAAGRRAVSAMRARGGRTRPQEFLVIEHEHPHRHDIDHGHTHRATSVGAGGAVHAHGPATDPAADRAHRHRHRHVLPVPADPFAGPGLRRCGRHRRAARRRCGDADAGRGVRGGRRRVRTGCGSLHAGVVRRRAVGLQHRRRRDHRRSAA